MLLDLNLLDIKLMWKTTHPKNEWARTTAINLITVMNFSYQKALEIKIVCSYLKKDYFYWLEGSPLVKV